MNKCETALNKARTEAGKTSQELGNATTALNNLESGADKAGDAAKDAGTDVGELADSVKRIEMNEALNKISDGIDAIAQKAIDAAKHIKEMVDSSSGWADDILTTSSQMGIDTDTLQEWQYAGRFIDVTAKDMATAQKTLTKRLNGDNKDTLATLEKLGVSTTDADGNLRDMTDVMMDAVDALGDIGNETERAQAAMDLFGGAASAMNPLIDAGTEAWKGYCDEAKEIGVVMSEENVAKLGSYNDQLQQQEARLESLKNEISVQVLPVFESLSTAVTNVVGAFSDWLSDEKTRRPYRRCLTRWLASCRKPATLCWLRCPASCRA